MTTPPPPGPTATPPFASADVVDEVAVLIARLRTVLSPADVYDDLTGDRLTTHLDDLKSLSCLTTASQARAAAAYAKTGDMRRDGHASMRNHFRSQGHSDTEAAQLDKLADGLGDAPETAAALAAGDITPETAGAIVDAVKRGRLGDDPEQVDKELVRIAKQGPIEDLRGHVKREEHRRDGGRLLKDTARQRKMRAVSLHEQPDGMYRLHGLLPAEMGEKAKVLFSAATTRDPAGTPEAEKRTAVQRTADALDDVFDWQLAHRHLPTDHGQARPHVTVTVDSKTVVTDMSDPTTGEAVPPNDPKWADLPPGKFQWSNRPVPPQTIRRICCDASLTRLLTNQLGQVLDAGRATPTWSGPQRTAIRFRDGQCRGPFCARPIGWTEIHHVQWHRHDGPTNLDNGISLCRRCHDLIHHEGWQVQLDPLTAEAIWTSPTGDITVTRPNNDVVHERQPS